MLKETMKGINLGGWFSQIDAIEEKDPLLYKGVDYHLRNFIDQYDIIRISHSGFDHVRLPLDYQIFFSENGELIFEERMEILEGVVREITSSGLMVILDLHECPGHDFDKAVKSEQDFFTDKRKRAAAKEVWMQLCKRFGNNPMIFLEILNEPVAPDDQIWNTVKDEMADFIRLHAQNSTLVIASNSWNSPSTFSQLKPLDDPNVLYSFHFYSPLLFTHQKAPWLDDPQLSQSRKYPGDYRIDKDKLKDTRLEKEQGLWNKERILHEIEPVLHFRDRYGVQVACNEFGVFHQAPRDSQLHWISDFISILKEYGIGYSYWNYKNLDFGLVSIGEKLHHDLPQFANKRRLDKELLDILCGKTSFQ